MPYPPQIDGAVDFTDAPPGIAKPQKHAVFRRTAFHVTKWQNRIAQQWVELEDVHVRSALTIEQSQRSFGRAHDPIGSVSTDRFAFAPLHEELEVHWNIAYGEQFVYQMKFELIGNAQEGGGAVSRCLWTRTLTWVAGNCPAQGHIILNGDLQLVPPAPANPENLTAVGGVAPGSAIVPLVGLAPHFPDDVLTAEFSPYKLKVSVEDPAGALTLIKSARWVYLDVLIHELNLDWGDQAVLAVSPTLGTTAVERDHDVLNKLRVVNDPANLGNALPTPGQTKRVYLLSNNFYMAVAEQTNNAGYDAHLAAWGTGPKIPIFVEPQIRTSDNPPQGVAVPQALGDARIHWEWEDAHQNRTVGMHQHDIDYLTAADNYNPAVFPAEYPNGGNCHEDRGGKRGVNYGHRVIPNQAGYASAAALAPNQFPFAVQACPNHRTWASTSTFWPHGSAPAAAGKSGVLFSPSRMTGDAYVLHAHLFYPAVDLDQVGAAFTAAVGNSPNRVSTGRFEVWRYVEIAAYYRKTAAGIARPAVTQGNLDQYFENSFVKVHLPALQTFTAANWNASMAVAVGATELYIQDAVDPAFDQHGGGTVGVYFRNHAAFVGEIDNRAGGAANVAAFLGATATFNAPPNDPFTGNPLWDDDVYNTAGTYDFNNNYTRISWSRQLMLRMMEHRFTPAANDGIFLVEVGELADNGSGMLGPNGFAVHFLAAQPHGGALVLCGVSNVETVAHEIGHSLYLNHCHDRLGDPTQLHHANHVNCLMSYFANRQFCGACQLRTRGWSLYHVNNAAGAYGAARTLWPEPAHNQSPLPGGVAARTLPANLGPHGYPPPHPPLPPASPPPP